jgi:hypothetical protein
MPDHNVKLNYVPTGKPAPNDFEFVPEKNPIKVKTGQTIAFTGPADGKIRLTFDDPHLFANGGKDFPGKGVFHDGDGVIEVVAVPQNKTSYLCELLDAQGNVKAKSHTTGGDIVPDKGN